MFRVSAAAIETGLAADCGHEIPGVLAVLVTAGPCLIGPRLRLHCKGCQGAAWSVLGSAERACPWVAVWVADGRLRALSGVARRCSGSLFSLVTPG